MRLHPVRRFGALLLALLTVLTLPVLPAAAAVQDGYTVTLSMDTLSMTQDDARVPLKATVKDGDSTVFENKGQAQGLVWSSSDPEVAVVNQYGGVEAVGEGDAVITATYTTTDPGTGDEKTGSATCDVTVVLPEVPIDDKNGVYINERPDAMDVNDTLTLTVTVNPTDATEGLEWEIEGDSGIVSLSPRSRGCVITAKKPGEVTIVVKAQEGPATDSCDIAVSGITLDETSLNLLIGETRSLIPATYGDAPEYDSIVWSSTNISVAEVVDGRINALYPGTTTIIARAGLYSASCTVTVKDDVAEFTESVNAGVPLEFSTILSDINSACRSKTSGSSLAYINSLQVSPNEGALYYGYLSSGYQGAGVGSEAYYVEPGAGQLDIESLCFVPNADFTGTAVITYSGRAVNGKNFRGRINVRVTAGKDVSYSTTSDRAVYFEAEDFSTVSRARLGQDVISVSFVQPTSRKGMLYYNYSEGNVYNPQVTSDIDFYRTKTPRIDDVVFVPDEDYDGEVEITYYCKTAAGSFSGKVKIDVKPSTELDEGRITYDVTAGGTVDLDADDFNKVCRELTDAVLNYVYFDFASTEAGTLYYNYNNESNFGTKVSSDTRYYRSSSPRISYITFVADEGFYGSVTIPFTAYATSGESFTGDMVIDVDDSDGVIEYRSKYGEAIHFDPADFNELCQEQNGESLDYVTFERPAAGRGTLYRSTSYTSNTKITNTMKFYRRGGTYQIDDEVLVPNSSYTGTFDIPFSGYDESDGRISGVVRITVDRQDQEVALSYQTVSGGLIRFNGEDFNIACQLITGERLNYVQFKLPATSAGKLYYNYDTGRASGTSVNSTTGYYRASSSRLIDDVAFLANDSYTGRFQLRYTGVAVDRSRYEGTVEITVLGGGGVIDAVTGSSLPIQLPTNAFVTACRDATGRSLASVRFTELPESIEGRLYLNYLSPMRPGTEVKTGINYNAGKSPSIDQISFVPRAGYQGYVSLPYVGIDTEGRSFNGVLNLHLANQHGTNSFTDMGNYPTARPSVEFLYKNGVVTGYGDGTFGPARSITRGEFAVMIYRAFELPDAASSYSFPDVPTTSFYAAAVAAAKARGIVLGSGEAYMPQNTITRQDAMTIVLRAMEATGKTVPIVSTTGLSSYIDGTQVSDYARSAVSTFAYMGAVDINASRQLRPNDALTRAEMAVLLHHVLTQ